MAFDGLNWTGGAPPRTAETLAAARRAAAAAERAWRETFGVDEDPDGAAPPRSSHPEHAGSRERFRRAHARLVALRDAPADGLEDAPLDA